MLKDTLPRLLLHFGNKVLTTEETVLMNLAFLGVSFMCSFSRLSVQGSETTQNRVFP